MFSIGSKASPRRLGSSSHRGRLASRKKHHRFSLSFESLEDVMLPSSAAALCVVGFSSPTVAGTGQTFTVTAQDAGGNVATD